MASDFLVNQSLIPPVTNQIPKLRVIFLRKSYESIGDFSAENKNFFILSLSCKKMVQKLLKRFRSDHFEIAWAVFTQFFLQFGASRHP